MGTQKKRESNIELLRIFSMFFILIYHFIIHYIQPDNPDMDYIIRPIITFLHIGVICFVLISGYWGIKFSVQSFSKLVIQCVFYSVLIYGIYALINPDEFSFKNLIFAFLPTQWWFIQIYLCLVLLSPIINIPLKTKSGQKKIIYIISLAVISCVLGQFFPSLSDGKNPINFVLIYYIGNFIRYNLIRYIDLNIRKLLFIYISCNILLFFSLLCLSDIPFASNTLFRLTFPYNSIVLIINASLVFLIFSKIQIKSKFINWIAASILPVYLIHENMYSGRYLYDFISDMQIIKNPVIYISAIVLLAITVLLVCVFIDKLLSYVIKAIENILFRSRMFIRINDKVNFILQKEEDSQS